MSPDKTSLLRLRGPKHKNRKRSRCFELEVDAETEEKQNQKPRQVEFTAEIIAAQVEAKAQQQKHNSELPTVWQVQFKAQIIAN